MKDLIYKILENSIEQEDFNKFFKNDVICNDKFLLNKYHLKKLTLTRKNNYVILSLVIVENKNGGYGSIFMNALINWADKNNIKLALTPDDSFGASSVSRLKKFYKKFGFVENKGRHIDYSINETMIRLPK